MPAYQPNWLERLTLKTAAKVGRFALRKLLGVRDEPSYEPALDQHISLEIPADEAATGSEESVTFKRGNRTRKLQVKIPPGIKQGTKIRLRGAGAVANHKQGDLYLHIKIKD
ncbi:DnaJ C-terminal domain-containing protein [Chloroflexota bacterium]